MTCTHLTATNQCSSSALNAADHQATILKLSASCEGDAQLHFLCSALYTTHLKAYSKLSAACDRMHHIVLDEADLLLSGGFEQQVGKILDAMQQGDKERKAQCISQELGIAVETFQGLQRHIKAAAYTGTSIPLHACACMPHLLF